MRRSGSTPAPERFAIVLGAMKCGTTTLFEHLAAHPEVCACSIKEPDFFTDEGRWSRGFAWYRDLWDWDPSRHRVALESSTSYTMHPRVPCPAARIAELEGDLRFVYVVRDPLERIESEIRHEIGNGRWHPDRRIDRVPSHMLAVSDYAMQLDPYRRRFGRERLLLLSLADLRERPVETLRSVCRFIGVDPSFHFPRPAAVANAARNYHPLYYWLAQVPGLPWLARHSPLAPRRAIRRALARPPDPEVRLDDSQRAELREALRPSVERLAAEYGFDTDPWLAPVPRGT